MENKVKNVLSGIGFYGTLAVCLLVVGVCACLHAAVLWPGAQRLQW